MARRSPNDAAALDPALTQKKRARRRLVGALVLGIAAAIVLPLVLDSEPRQTISDVEIEIPPREAALPEIDSPPDLAVAPSSVSPADDAVVLQPPSEPVAAPASDAGVKAETKAETKTEPKAQAGADAKAQAGADAKAQAGADAKAQAGADANAQSGAAAKADPKGDAPAEPRRGSKTEAPKVAAARPRAEPPGGAGARAESPATRSVSASPSAKADAAAASTGTRFALQVGAFSNAGSARAQLDKARRTGLRAYTETVKTSQGDRTRVRVGPFPTRDEAEKARATLKLAGIDSAVVDAR